MEKLRHFPPVLQLYDLNTPSYETVLTPIDFEMAMEWEEAGTRKKNRRQDDDWDSEAMYNLDKFEGDIANDVLSREKVKLIKIIRIISFE